ncbi:MAG: aminoglycoside 6-adenylyltransferase [Chloroflexota bacterium]
MGDYWQGQAVEQLEQFFYQEPEARAFVLGGSLAVTAVPTDIWSDVDARIILADGAVEHYYLSTTWLFPFGRLIGNERHENHLTKTMRVCLENGRRFDLTFIAESTMQNPALWDRNPFYPAYRVVWSRLPDLEKWITSLPTPAEYQDTPWTEIDRMVAAFWFKAALAIAKVARNDLLIGLHLALDLARDGLVLQMTQRDREIGTRMHRIGGWGNELAARFVWQDRAGSGEAILDFIQLSCEIFDELAADLLPDYDQRSPLLLPTLELAKQTLP